MNRVFKKKWGIVLHSLATSQHYIFMEGNVWGIGLFLLIDSMNQTRYGIRFSTAFI